MAKSHLICIDLLTTVYCVYPCVSVLHFSWRAASKVVSAPGALCSFKHPLRIKKLWKLGSMMIHDDPWIHIVALGSPVWACLGTQPCVRLPSGEFAMCTDSGEASAMGPGPGAATQSSKLSSRSFNTNNKHWMHLNASECKATWNHPSRLSLRYVLWLRATWPISRKCKATWHLDCADCARCAGLAGLVGSGWMSKAILRHFDRVACWSGLFHLHKLRRKVALVARATQTKSATSTSSTKDTNST